MRRQTVVKVVFEWWRRCGVYGKARAVREPTARAGAELPPEAGGILISDDKNKTETDNIN